MRYALVALLLVVGCNNPKMSSADDALLARYEALVKETSANQGNTNEDLRAIEERLGNVEKKLGSIEKLLSLPAEISIEVPKAADPPPMKADAPPAEKADQRITGPTLNGKPLDVAATIKANYRRMWSFPGSIDSHLAEHGVAGTAGLDYETKRKLHSALHEMGVAPVKAVVKTREVVRAPMAMPQQSCPTGNCPNARVYGYSTGRSRLFGWRR